MNDQVAGSGVTPPQRDLILKSKVLLFGSRAKGSARQYSDLDLALQPSRSLTSAQLRAIREIFSESDLPFLVDLVIWEDLDPEFQKLIERECVEF